MSRASSKLSEARKSGVSAKSWGAYGTTEIISEFKKNQGAYYTWGHIIHGNLLCIIKAHYSITSCVLILSTKMLI